MENCEELLDKLINNEDPYVRLAVVEQGFGLEILINDEDWHVRKAVAEQGFGLEKLVNDEDWHVVDAVKDKLIEMIPKITESTNKASKSKPEPFEFVSKILSMDLETQNEIFPEVGSTENIFKYFTFEEALERYNNWHKCSIEGVNVGE